MVIHFDCWKHTIFIKEKSCVKEESSIDKSKVHSTHLTRRSPSPNCQCSCHNRYPSTIVVRSSDYSTISTIYDFNHPSSHLYSTVLKNKKFNKNTVTYESDELIYSNSCLRSVSNPTSVTPNYRQQKQQQPDSNYSDIISVVNVYEAEDRFIKQNQQLSGTDTSLSSSLYHHYHPKNQQVPSFKIKKPENIIHLLRIDPFKFATMEPLHVGNKIIVFSLVDTFTKLSPNKILENYIKKLQEEGKTNITIFNLSEPLQYLRNALIVPICEYGWPEKRAPSLEKLCSLCKSIDSWLNADRSRNISIIYSKRDLSRASLAIAVFLQYIQICLGNDTVFDFESMYNYFHFNLENYLRPSQKRYVNYFKNLLSGDSKINNQKFYLNQIVLRRIPNFDGNGLCKPFIKVYQGLNLVYSSRIFNIDQEFAKTWDFIVFDIKPPLKLRGEILIKCYHKILSPSSRTEMFSFQFHTGTLTSNLMVFNKNEIDIALYDKRFHEDTRVELIFNDAHSELVQNVEFIEDNQITKCNSYENFFSEASNLEYTKGPLDGSLYATVSKKTAIINRLSPTSHQANDDEVALDELINEIFSEIQSFPDVSSNLKQQESYEIYYDYLTLSKNSSLKKSINNDNIKENINPGVDESTENLDWLQKQQQKLKTIRQKKFGLPRKDFVEQCLITELKNTIVNPKNNIKLHPPEVPARTSSRNILLEFKNPGNKFHHNALSSPGNDGVLCNSSFDIPDHAIYQEDNANNQNEIDPNDTVRFSMKPSIRSSTPAFPVRQQEKLPKHKESELHDNNNNNNNNLPLFIKDTSAYWYKPNISREEAVKYLYNKPSGSFIIRDSNSFPNAYGLAVKVPLHESRSNLDPVRHFLIESTNKGVQIKGCPEEPIFSSLAALVYQHSITKISLPVVLIIPSSDDIDIGNDSYLKRFYDNGAACNVLYFSSNDVESLTGPIAIKKVIDDIFENKNKFRPAVIHFKASSKGITLTDNNHRIFFRQHYPLKSISFCSIDPENRSWFYNLNQIKIQSYLFGFVTRKKSSNLENACLIFGHFEPDQPPHAIVDFVNKLIKS